MSILSTTRRLAASLALVAGIAFLLPSAMAQPTAEVEARAAKIIADQYKVIINCEGCNLAGANFDGQFLRLAALEGANMSGATFRDADLTGIHLTRANLAGADFSGANMAGAVLTNADLRGANLSDARLDAVRVHGANFTGANLQRANLRMLEYVKRLTFAGADARDAIFRHAFLGGVDFNGTDLRGADFTRATGLTNAQLARACGDERTILPPGLSIPRCGGS
ncbi:MAG: pentapeptide repeat-containing protein [Parvibaculum sp.]|uniref:pentapeptide repeat-containing protein n=1 Tax=Parvibaculum sp. TaxID=2024848 RepID=UPI002727ABD7|nr:pentapeptide repeat-containing protein [Parvibaculum sp.]MDO8839421.1 pentapeptide repeat-containing protein [Parvibaculum sp.]